MSPATSRNLRTSDLNDFDTTPDIAGFLVDDQGQEIPITEQMIQQACDDFHRQWRPAPRRAASPRQA